MSPEAAADDQPRDAAAADARLVARAGRNPWTVILGVGALCWLVLGCAAILWMLPWSGTVTAEGDYVISAKARAVQYLMVFMVAAFGYRLAVALGWPDGALARTRVVVANVILTLAVVAWSNLALALVAGFVDGRMTDMHETLVELQQLPSNLRNPQQLEHTLDLMLTPLLFFLPPYVLGLCAIALVMVTERQHREALRTAELARAYDAARMAMLSAQLQPHFLFNSLHAVIGLIDDNPRQAATMLVRLGDFLRHALETSQSPWVAVATELAGLEAYLGVQQTRFSDRLSISIDASPESLGVYLPSMLLQPLVENAIEHGRSDGGPPLRLRVAASVSAEHLCIVVNNSSPQLPADLTPADYGHGLANVDLRLRAAYGGAAHLGIGPDQQGGTSAILVLPVRRRPGPGRLAAVPT
jgi:hypothetical protein